MRIILSALLLASVAAVPAMAQDRPHGDGGHHEQGPHGGGPGGPPPQQPHPQVHEFQGGRPDGGRPGGFQGQGFDRHPGPDRPVAAAPADQHRDFGRPGGDHGWNGDHRPAPAGFQGDPHVDHRWDGHDDGRHDDHRNDWDHRDWNHNNDHGSRGNPPPPPGRPGGWNGDHGRPGGWDHGWRNDRRYDWQGWRNSHRDIYRGGFYRPPYGYGSYRRWDVGVRLPTVLFAQNYWISDPGYYRLPPIYGPYRWIRYYNDALLIDTYSGEVVDMIPDFFW
jgi:Ni/Co efflux regulator RcnB